LDDPEFREIAEAFVTRLQEQLQAIEAAWLARDYDTLRGLAHWLKGSGGTVGFHDFTQPAKKLEELARAQEDGERVEQVIFTLRQLADRIVLPACADAEV
jgi:HPt (histidine-containing phosphotransfer) domain-containing protein